jgi:hypothetical protein
MLLSSLEKFFFPRAYRLRVDLNELVERAAAFGLPDIDLANAREMLEYNEGGEALDIILVQLYEYSIAVDETFIIFAQELCASMKISWEEYDYVSELVK